MSAINNQLLTGLLRGLGQFPLPVLHALGASLSVLFGLLPNRRLRRARINLRLCFPELSHAERGRLTRQSMRHLGRTMLETPRLWFGPHSRVRRLFREVRGTEHLQAALAEGRGVILLAPHLSWEAAVLCAGLHAPTTFLYSPQKLIIESLMCAGRGRFGTRLVQAIPGQVRAQLQGRLDAGEAVLILPDQDPPPGRGIFAPFFGVPAHTPTLAARLANTTQARVLLMQVQRLRWSRGFQVSFLPAPADIAHPDPERAAAAVNAAMEQCIRPFVGQYMWNVRRFVRRPPGQPMVY
ncbi:MAG: lysophospholipid acyltransferase family protein [Nevskiales bacterium]